MESLLNDAPPYLYDERRDINEHLLPPEVVWSRLSQRIASHKTGSDPSAQTTPLQRAASTLLHTITFLQHIIEPYSDASGIVYVDEATAIRLRQEAAKAVKVLEHYALFSQRTREGESLSTGERRSELSGVILERITSQVESLSAVLKSDKQVLPESALEALQNFNGSFPQSTIISLVDDTDVEAAEMSNDNPVKVERDICPLEKFFLTSIRSTNLSAPAPPYVYELAPFAIWGTEEGYDSQVNALVGPMKSAHLYRSRKFLHHEFALICFGKPDIPESWIRVERAARRKTARLLLQADSFGPLFNGVPVRESLSFGSRREDLCRDADELTSITAVPGGTTANHIDVLDHLHLSEVASQLRDTTQADPLYLLFSANCRWFARRTILSVAQRLSSIGALGCIIWKSTEIDLELLVDNLLSDKFGGRQLSGNRAEEIKASNLLNLSQTSAGSNREENALAFAQKALHILQQIRKPNCTQMDLISRAHRLMGFALMKKDRLTEALSHLEMCRGRDASSLLEGGIEKTDEVYAECLSRLGRYDEAIRIRARFIQRLRNKVKEIGSDLPSLISLARSMLAHAYVLSSLGRLEEALAHARKGVDVRRGLARYRPDLYQSELGAALHSLTHILLRLEQSQPAHAAATEALHIARERFDNFPKPSRRNLAVYLFIYSKACQAIGDQAASIKAAEESAARLEELYHLDAVSHLSDLSQAIKNWAELLFMHGRLGEAVEKFMLALSLESKLHFQDPARYDRSYSETLQVTAGACLLAHDERAPSIIRQELDILQKLRHTSAISIREVTGRLLFLGRNCNIQAKLCDTRAASSWALEVVNLGCKAASQAVSLYEGHKNHSDPLAWAESYTVLTMCQVTKKSPVEALEAICQALRVYSHIPAHNNASLGSLCKALLQCQASLDLASQLNVPDLAVSRIPDHLLMIARKLRGSPTSPVLGQCESALMDTILVCASLHGQQSPWSSGLVLALLDEAYPILRNLVNIDHKRHVNTSCHMADIYAKMLAQVGRNEEAVEASGLSLEGARLLCSVDRSLRRREALSIALSSHAGILHIAGKSNVAYGVCAEAITLLHQLCAVDHGHHLRTLACTCSNAAFILRALARNEESVELAIEALQHDRVLQSTKPADCLPRDVFKHISDLVARFCDMQPHTLLSRRAALVFAEIHYDLQPNILSGRKLLNRLHGLALKLAEGGDLEEAVNVGERAAAHGRSILAHDEDCRPNVAEVLDNLASDRLNQGAPSEALPLLAECTAHYRLLLIKNQRHRWKFSHVLYLQAATLLQLEKPQDATQASSEGLVLSREEYGVNPSHAVLHALVASLITHAECEAAINNLADSRCTLEESMILAQGIHEDVLILVAKQGRFSAELADKMWLSGQREDAFALVDKAISLYRTLYAADHEAYREPLCRRLLSYIVMAGELSARPSEIIPLAAEAVELTRSSYDRDPLSYADAFLDRKMRQALWHQKAGNAEEVVTILRDALPQIRKNAGNDHDAWSRRLAQALQTLHGTLEELGRPGEAIIPLAELIPVLRRLTLIDPTTYEPRVEYYTSLFHAAMKEEGRESGFHIKDEDSVNNYGTIKACVQALLPISQAIISLRTQWRSEGQAQASASSHYEEIGIALYQSYARHAGILFAHGRRKDAAAVLQEEARVMREVLLRSERFTPSHLWGIASEHRDRATKHLADSEYRDAIDCARQYLLVARIALEATGGDSAELDEGTMKISSERTLARVLSWFADLAMKAGQEEDATEALLERSLLPDPPCEVSAAPRACILASTRSEHGVNDSRAIRCCVRDLLPVADSIISLRAQWKLQGKAKISVVSHYEETGTALYQSYARYASILFAHGRRKDGAAVLLEEARVVREVLLEVKGLTPSQVRHMASEHRDDARKHVANGEYRDAIESARQFLLIARLAFDANGGDFPARDRENGLGETLCCFAQLAEDCGEDGDAEEAMMEYSSLGGV